MIKRTLCLLAVLCASAAVDAATIDERLAAATFRGLIESPGETRYAEVTFKQADGQWRATLADPERGGSIDVAATVDGDTVALQMPGYTPLACSGTLHDGEWTSAPDAVCRVTLVAVPPFAEPRTLMGAYRAPDGTRYAIGTMADFPQLEWVDYQTGEWRFLQHRGDRRFTAGSGLSKPLPVAFTVEQISADALRVTRGDAAPVSLQRIALRERPLAWSNGSAELRGTLILPEGPGPFPAVVLTQMSAPAPRDAYLTYGYFFATRGIAALIYDRRGLGESKGAPGGMRDLADDAIAGVEALRAFPEIDAARIGTWGHSQGGWIAPIAAARSSHVAFVIAQSAPAVTAAEQEIFRVENNARDAGLSEDEIAAAVDYEKRLMGWVRDGSGREEVLALSKANAASRWARYVELRDTLPEAPSATSRTFWWFDPAEDLRRVKVPALLVYGNRDGFVPVEKSIRLMREAFEAGGNDDVQITTLDDATHGLWSGPKDAMAYGAITPGFHADYWRTLDAWLVAHGYASAGKTGD